MIIVHDIVQFINCQKFHEMSKVMHDIVLNLV